VNDNGPENFDKLFFSWITVVINPWVNLEPTSKMRRAHTSDSNYGSPYGHNQQMGDAAVETENDRLTDKVKGQIGLLRSLAIDIGSEVTGQNKYLREMDDDFDRAGGFLGKAMNRVKGLASGSHNHVVLYLILFSLVVFLFIWLII